jgi:hypothetical protein
MIRKITLAPICFLVLFYISSCCNEKNDFTGAVIEEYTIEGNYSYLSYQCLGLIDALCIKNDSAYKSVFKINTADTICADFVLPAIDFEKYTILVSPQSDMKRTFYHKNVDIDSANKLITYTITTTRCMCADVCESFSLNMVAIPKISDDYRIEFK